MENSRDIDQDSLRAILNSGKLEPFIRSVRFPFYKGIAENEKIDFTFPITAIVGGNGTHKSSILRALEGCVDRQSIGRYWFSTDLDPISKKSRNRVIHAYNLPSGRQIESIKSRITFNKGNPDPDYWEPSRPLRRAPDSMDAMEDMTDTPEIDRPYRSDSRWSAIKKATLYIDFRYQIPSFDLFYRLKAGKKDREHLDAKKFLRRRSKKVKEAFDHNQTSTMYFGVERIIEPPEILSPYELHWVSQILGRRYTEIQLLRHTFFEIEGYTARMKTSALDYSEAFAGSGEFCVVNLVHQIVKAPNRSLILIDEPEISLHPQAQRELTSFLYKEVSKSFHQIVLATHSPTIVEQLPPEAIKVFEYIDNIGKARLLSQETSAGSAFQRLGAPGVKPKICVEDKLAAKVVEAAISTMGKGFDNVEIQQLGSADRIVKKILPTAAELNLDVLFLLDGDKRSTPDNLKDTYSVSSTEGLNAENALDRLNDLHLTTKDLGASGGNDKSNKDHIDKAINILKFADTNLNFLPFSTPEEFLIQFVTNFERQEGEDEKDYWLRYAEAYYTKRIGSNAISSEDIFSLQDLILQCVPDDNKDLKVIADLVRPFLERSNSRKESK